MQNILVQYIVWQFFEVPREILKAWKNFLLFNLNYFSVPLLLKTFFSHWRRYRWSYGKGFDPGRYLETFFSNLISRVLGAIVRTFAIVIGILSEIGIFFGGVIVFFGWLLFPAFLIAGLIFGIRIIF
ncbi:MAG: hypothetical protein PHE52_03325 [Candidatus Pacebacteria bacterium]|nr:hypothetical protein [Candidatus Paceibacterota bacterium]